MEIRDIEIFLTLCEELHFGRTAERLHVTSARISQAIRKQERAVGAPLFHRTSRSVRLTPLGEQLRRDLTQAYQALKDSIDRAALAARDKRESLRLGMIGGGIARDLRPVLDLFAGRHPLADLQIRSMTFSDPFGPLRRGEVDLAVLWLPVQEGDLTVGPVLFSEPIVLIVPAGHPLAAQESVSLEVLADEIVVDASMPRYWREALLPVHTPSGRPIRTGPQVHDLLEVFAVVTSGEGVCLVHAQTARYFARPDIVYVPVHDAPLARWALVWRCDTDPGGLVHGFADAVRDHGPLAL
ncbi:LysR family transcriptional regulator [Nonomuraea soli]|uniref:DNA-binding transcriptional LysR family regulator n=1 Tax=Nonomuraea soli TaxID=1032476 RepID=A0A7W0HV77_9ACTN|nr:LysR family transcriptional regulator [Nonomuraea soli]MBA2896964.1 DNA-binding transcriptional LysR family regulator [Nonomuraea soli]